MARVPSVELVRLVSSGTEATMSAIRVARGFTGRPKVVKFAGNYHGHGDLLLAEAGSGLAALGLPGSAGVTDAAVSDTVVAPYNVVPELDGDTACVIVEPIAANMGLVPPDDGFLKGLRAECDRVGALLVFDEVITGFRVAYGGAQATCGITPDLSTFGKVIGGGLNIGAYGGRRDVMQQVAPLGPVYQAGTLSGNPSRPPPAWRRSSCSTRRPTPRWPAPPNGWPMVSAPRSTRRASRRSCRGSTASSASSSAPTRRSTTRAPSERTRPATPRSSTPCSTVASPWPPVRTR